MAVAAALQNPIVACIPKLCEDGLNEFANVVSQNSAWETIQRVALGALVFLISIPLFNWAEYAIENLMNSWGIELTASQDVIAIWTSMAVLPPPLSALLLTVFLVYIVIIGPIIEEFMFREVLHGCLQQNINNPLMRTLVNGTLFGAAHLSPFQGWTNLPIFLITGLMGCVFAALREISGDTIAPSTAHMLNNGVSMAHFLLK